VTTLWRNFPSGKRKQDDCVHIHVIQQSQSDNAQFNTQHNKSHTKTQKHCCYVQTAVTSNNTSHQPLPTTLAQTLLTYVHEMSRSNLGLHLAWFFVIFFSKPTTNALHYVRTTSNKACYCEPQCTSNDWTMFSQTRDNSKPQVPTAIRSNLHTGVKRASHVAVILKLHKRRQYTVCCVTGFPVVRGSASIGRSITYSWQYCLQPPPTPPTAVTAFCGSHRDARRLPHTLNNFPQFVQLNPGLQTKSTLTLQWR
jgi:hypothetical protein